jgi:hypothetical protein
VTSDVPPHQNPDSTAKKKKTYNVELPDSSLKFDVTNTTAVSLSPPRGHITPSRSLVPFAQYPLTNRQKLSEDENLPVYFVILW